MTKKKKRLVKYEVGLEHCLFHNHFYSTLEEKNEVGLEMPSVK